MKDHERVRDLLQRSANLEFYETYQASELQGAMMNLIGRLANDSTVNAAPLQTLLSQPGYGATVGYAPDAMAMERINALLATPVAKAVLPSDLKLRWSVKPTVRVDNDGTEHNFGYALYALKAPAANPPSTVRP